VKRRHLDPFVGGSPDATDVTVDQHRGEYVAVPADHVRAEVVRNDSAAISVREQSAVPHPEQPRWGRGIGRRDLPAGHVEQGFAVRSFQDGEPVCQRLQRRGDLGLSLQRELAEVLGGGRPEPLEISPEQVLERRLLIVAFGFRRGCGECLVPSERPRSAGRSVDERSVCA
jgi:hypothetical protein